MSDPITSGIPQLDRMIGGGLRPGQLTVIAGMSQSGMSTMLDTIARSAAFNENVPTLLVDCETTLRDRAKRVLSAVSGIDLHKVQRNQGLSDDERGWLRRVAELVKDAPLMQADPRRVRDLRRIELPWIPRVILVDGVRFLDRPEELYGPTHEAKLVADLRQVADGWDAALVVTSPLVRYDETPMLSALSEGLAFTADHVVLIDRPELRDDALRRREVDLIVAKSRGGQVGTVTVAAEFDRARFMPLPWTLAA